MLAALKRAGGGSFPCVTRSDKESCETENSTYSLRVKGLAFLQTRFSYVFSVYELIFAIKIFKLWFCQITSLCLYSAALRNFTLAAQSRILATEVRSRSALLLLDCVMGSTELLPQVQAAPARACRSAAAPARACRSAAVPALTPCAALRAERARAGLGAEFRCPAPGAPSG